MTVYEAVGGTEGVLRLAHAWHERVMADEIVSHAFGHGFHPRHTERLAAYWGEVEGRFVELIDAKRIEQADTFESDEPEYSGVMRMAWTLDPVENGTLVSVRAEDVPPGIRPEDHEVGLNESLDNLASLFGARPV